MALKGGDDLNSKPHIAGQTVAEKQSARRESR